MDGHVAALKTELDDLLSADPDAVTDRLREASTAAQPMFALLGRAGTLETFYHVGARKRVRFSELESTLDISSSTLAARLSELEDAGFLERTLYDENPPRVEYAPTEKFYALKPVFYHLIIWAEQYGYDSAPPNSESAPDRPNDA